jgi:hemolysin activation/secretion protein
LPAIRRVGINLSMRWVSLGVALYASGLAPAFAQAPVPVPPSTDPGRQEQRLAPPPAPLPGAPAIQVPSGDPGAAPAGAAEIRFTLAGLQIDGVTIYRPEQLQVLYRDLVGRDVTLDQVFKLAAAITLRYRRDGYILSQALVPAQEIRDGRVRIAVVEGFIGAYSFAGDAPVSTQPIKRYADRIIAERPLRAATLERYLLLMNDLPGVTARVTLLASDKVGASDMLIEVQEKRVDGYVTIDNRGTRFLGPTEGQAGVRANGLFGSGAALGLRGLVTAPASELRLGELNGELPLGDDGWRAGLRVSRSDTRPGFTLRPLDVDGAATSVTVDLAYPLRRSREGNLTATGRVTWRESETRSFQTVLSEDSLRVLGLAANWDLADAWRGITFGYGEISQGLEAFGASRAGSLNLSRASGRPDFTKVAAGISRVQGLTEGINLRADVEGQYAFAQLLASEQYGLGGARLGRAYDPSEVVGDHGLGGRLELQWTPDFAEFGVIRGVQFYGYYDLGRVWRIDGNPGGLPQSLASAGGGARLSIAGGIAANAEITQPLTLNPATEGNRDPRFFFSVTKQF